MCRKIYFVLLCIMLVVCFALPGFAESYNATTAGTHAIELTSGTQSCENITVTKTGDATGSSDGTSGYDWTGSNAAVFAGGGAKLTITGSDSSISSTAVGGNAVFSYGGNLNGSNSGDGTTITISDAAITTNSNNSGGIMVTGGGVIDAGNLTITTNAGSSAAIRSDRGGGTITVNGGTYTTHGVGSPAIYCTADITGSDVTLTTTNSQAVVIEGGNSVTLSDSTLNANNATKNGQDNYQQAVLIYQSGSGDASDGSSSFAMTGGSITNTVGDIFHVTNTTTAITLNGVTITNNDSSGYFLRASTDSWGKSGSNGGKVTMNAADQTIAGNILVDSVSTLTLNLNAGSAFNGAVNTSSQAGTVKVNVASGATWTLTANSHVSSLTNKGTINQGSYTLYVNGSAYDGSSESAGSDDSTTSSDASPEITTTSLKDGKVGKTYSVTVRADGKKPITWTASNLPDGLSMSSSGKITGKPTASGTYSVTLTAANSGGSTSKTLSLDIADIAPKIKVSSKSGIVGEAYSAKITLSAGTGSITWKLTGDLPDGLSFDSDTLVISGTPAEVWNKNVTVTAENSAGKAGKTFKLLVKAVKPSIKTKTLEDGTISTDYEASFDITGTSPITVTVTGLPKGLAYDSGTGKITGTPADSGKFTVKLTAKNAAGKSSRSYKLMIYAPPSINAIKLNAATAGKSYSAKLKASGTTPVTWEVSGGELPEGMSLNQKTGILKGKPALDGSYDITITATNSAGSDSASATLTVNAVAPKLSGKLKPGTAGKAYSATLKVKGTEPITWTYSGDLPDGITFSEGTFSGTSEKYFEGKVQVTVTHGTLSDSETYTLVMKAVAPKITTKTLTYGTVDAAYSETLEATGTPDITWSWSGYPSGLTLNASTGEISGTPTKAGSYRVKITAKNDAKSVSKTIRLVITENNASVGEENISDDAEVYVPEEYYSTVDELPEGFMIAAELGEISVKDGRMYDFAVTLSGDTPAGAKLFWVANSESHSEDDAIADFFDVDSQDIETVPESLEITVSAWLNAGVIYRPVIAVKMEQ